MYEHLCTHAYTQASMLVSMHTHTHRVSFTVRNNSIPSGYPEL